MEYDSNIDIYKVYTLEPTQNGRHFADDIIKCIFLNETFRNSMNISQKDVYNGLINNISALVQIMTWRLVGDKLLSDPIIVRRIYASLGLVFHSSVLNVLTHESMGTLHLVPCK